MARSTASNLDIAMAGQWTISALGPVEHGGRTRVQKVLSGLGTSGPRGRIGLLPESTTREWAFDPTRLDDAVFEVDPVDDPDGAVATMRRLAVDNPKPLSPIWVALAGDWIFVYLDHGVGDGFMTLGLSAALFGEPGTAAPWQQSPDISHPLAMALLGAIKNNPRLPLQTAVKALDRSSSADPQPDEMRPWSPAFDVAYSRGEPETFVALMQWRDANAPGVSSVALQSALRVRALREMGLDPCPTIKLLVDGRRYLPAGSLVTSNFAAGVDLEVDDPGEPQLLAEAVRRVTKSGSAAITLAATTATVHLNRMRSRPPSATQLIDVVARPNIAITDLGSPKILETLPWKSNASAPPTYIALVSPADPQAITFASGRLFGAVQEMASYHNNVFDRDIVQSVIDTVAHQPLRLLSPSRVG